MSLAKQIGSVSKTALTNAGHMNMNNEIYARVKTDTTKARKATDETLDLIIQRVNAYAVLEPTEAINAFIDTVNQIFRKYKNLIAAKGGPTPAPTPDPENPGGDSESPDEI